MSTDGITIDMKAEGTKDLDIKIISAWRPQPYEPKICILTSWNTFLYAYYNSFAKRHSTSK